MWRRIVEENLQKSKLKSVFSKQIKPNGTEKKLG